MDRVRFGRALGYGARHAAKALTEAAKAAATPSDSPSRTAGGNAPPGSSAARLPTLQEATARVAEAHQAVNEAKRRARDGAAVAGRSALAPVRRAGSVLWLEMTGCAFGIFVLFLAPGLWKLRGAVHAPPSSPEAQKFYLYLVVLVLFTYFAISSFVRANRRGKRP